MIALPLSEVTKFRTVVKQRILIKPIAHFLTLYIVRKLSTFVVYREQDFPFGGSLVFWRTGHLKLRSPLRHSGNCSGRNGRAGSRRFWVVFFLDVDA
jgi:hypothetical protein